MSIAKQQQAILDAPPAEVVAPDPGASTANNLTNGNNLAHSVVRGSIWILGGNMAGRVLSTLRMLLLAGLLTPEEYGLYGLVLVASGLFGTVTQIGTFDALVQRKDADKDYINTAWTLEIGRSLVIAAFLDLSAPLLGYFFNSDRVAPLITAYSLSIIITSCSNMGMVYFVKQLDLRKQLVSNLSGTVTSVIVSVILAYIFRSAWALVIGEIAGACARCIASYVLHPFRPRLDFDKKRVGELFRFSRWLVLNSAMNYGITMGDNAIVGRVLGANSLGTYQWSFNLSSAVGPEISNVVTQITYPAYSLLQDDMERLRSAYLRSLKTTMLIIAPVCLGLSAMAPILVPVLLNQKWIAAIPLLQVFGFYGIIRTFSSLTSPVFVAHGRPKYASVGLIVNLIAMVIITLPFTLIWGANGTAISVIIASFLFSATYAVLLVKNIGLVLSDLLIALARCLAPALVMGLVVVAALAFLPVNLIGLISGIALGAIVYLGAAVVADKTLVMGLYRQVRGALFAR